MSYFFIPRKFKDYKRDYDYGSWSVSLYSDVMICRKNIYQLHRYTDIFYIVLGSFVLKKFNPSEYKIFLENNPLFESYDLSWLWNRLRIEPARRYFDDCILCFLKLIGFPNKFMTEFLFDSFSVQKYTEKAKKQRDYLFDEGKPIKLGEVKFNRAKTLIRQSKE